MGARAGSLKSHGDDFAWSLLDATPDATVIVDSSGEIVFVNDHACKLFGYDIADLLGRPVEDLLPEALRAVHRADRTRYRAAPTVREMGSGLDLLALRSDGTEFPVEISLSPLRLDDQVFAVAAVRDITSRVEIEGYLHRVLRMVDATDDGLFIFDADTLRYSFVSMGAVRLVGYDRDELSSMTPLHLNPYTTEAEYRRLVDSLVADTDRSVVRQATMLRKDGSEIRVEKTYRSVASERDGNRWIIAVVRDVTPRLAAEAELAASQAALRAAAQAVAIVNDRERIARDLHDTVIQGLFAQGLHLQAALSGVADPDSTRLRIHGAVDGIDQAIRDLRASIFSLQAAAQVDGGGLRVRLLEIVRESEESLGCEPRLQFNGPIDSIPDRIAVELLPVLREALSNVARHAQARSVRVSVHADDDVLLTVIDDGVGVSGEVIGGRGLSNAIERARRLGGECTVAARPAGGTELNWRVPNDDAAQSG